MEKKEECIKNLHKLILKQISEKWGGDKTIRELSRKWEL